MRSECCIYIFLLEGELDTEIIKLPVTCVLVETCISRVKKVEQEWDQLLHHCYLGPAGASLPPKPLVKYGQQGSNKHENQRSAEFLIIFNFYIYTIYFCEY
jgi:hypothetical protein